MFGCGHCTESSWFNVHSSYKGAVGPSSASSNRNLSLLHFRDKLLDYYWACYSLCCFVSRLTPISNHSESTASIFCDYYRLVLKTGTMGKFKVLEYNQNYMARIGIHSHHLNESTNEFFKSFVSYYYLFVFSVIFITASAVNVYQSWPQMDIISEPCLIVIAGLQVTGMYLAVGLKMKKVKNLHIELQGIVDEGIICFSNEKCLQFDKLFIISKIKNMMCSTFIGKLSENVEDIRN